MTLEQKIEGILFYKAIPLRKTALMKLFGCSDADLNMALDSLSARLEDGATRLLISDYDIELTTAPQLNDLIESQRKEEMKRDIGKAGSETLAIILYKGPLTRADIDRIRGVNSSFILRNLLVRGLIEKEMVGKQALYSGTTELLSHLGISRKNELPGFADIMDTLESFESEQTMNT